MNMHRQSLAILTMAISLTAQAADPKMGQLEEIIVTATRHEESLSKVPISVTAMTQESLDAKGIKDFQDVVRFTPGVSIDNTGTNAISIRGISSSGGAGTTGIYIDDTPIQMRAVGFSPDDALPKTFDLDRVEVLRGPQGTLFGRNATGGLANFVTRRPSDEAGGYTDVTFGQRGLMRVEGAITGPVTDGIDARLSFETNHYDPLVHNLSGGAPDSENGNDWGVRGQLLFKDVGGGQLLLSARAAKQDVHAGAWEQAPISPGANGYDSIASATDNFYGTCPGCNASGLTASPPYTTRDNQAGYAKIQTNGFTAKYTKDFSGTTFTVIGDYSALKKDYQEDWDTSPYTIFQFYNGSDVKQQSLELRLNGGDKQLNWTAGLYALHINGQYYEGWQGPAFFGAEQYNVESNPNSAYAAYTGAVGPWPYTVQPGGAPPAFAVGGALPDANGGMPATIAPYELVTKSYAAFGQLEYRVSDLIGLTAGARVTKDDKDYTYSWHPYLYYPQSTTGATTTLTRPSSALLGNYAANRADTLWAGKLQADFHVAPDALLYVSYNRGVKGGGFTAPLFPATIADLKALTFKPEQLTSYEVGFKSEFFGHTLRVNGAAYYYDYKDYQALIYTVSLNQLIVNANASHKGAEFEMEWAPNESWRLGLGGSYVDAIVKNVAGLCCTTDGKAVYGDYIPPNAPKLSGNAMIRYTLPVGAGAHLAFQLDGAYLSKFWFNLGDMPAVQQDAYGIANARVSFTPASGKVELGVSVENLADKHYASYLAQGGGFVWRVAPRDTNRYCGISAHKDF